MAANPNTARITGPMWMLWERCDAVIPGVLLGGIYANKSGYHNTRSANSSTNYSVQLTLDRQGPSDKAAGLDLTMSTAEMRKRTTYLVAATGRNDPRMAAVREFYGTTNGTSVTGRSHDSRTGAWRAVTSDNSHLWHIHISIFRAYVNVWAELEPIVSVLNGETLAQWNARRNGEDDVLIGLKRGDSGNAVKELQSNLKLAGFSPGEIDGDYGSATSAALLALRKSRGSSATHGDSVDHWAYEQIITSVYMRYAGKDGAKGDPGPGPTATQIAVAVANWMAQFKDTLKPTAAEVEAFVTSWVEAHKEELRGPAGKTPTRIAITGDVIEAV